LTEEHVAQKDIGTMGNKIVWLVSYPRSGNTWLRLLLANVQYPEKVRGYVDIDKLTPDIHQKPWREVCAGEGFRQPVFVKSHHAILNLYYDWKVVYLYRDGRDVALSCYYYGMWAGTVGGTEAFKDYLRNKFLPGKVPFGRWKIHVAVWMGSGLGLNFLPIRYEDMLKDPAAELRKVLKYAGMEVSDEIITQAVDRVSFDRCRERAGPEGVHRLKLGLRGRDGGWREVFDEEMKAWFWEDSGRTLTKLGYGRE